MTILDLDDLKNCCKVQIFKIQLSDVVKHKFLKLRSFNWTILTHCWFLTKIYQRTRYVISEYRSMANTTCEVVWLLGMLRDLHVTHQGPALLYYDNQAALHIVANPVYHERSKHIELVCHFMRERIQLGVLKTMHVSTQNQLVDLLTKALHPTRFRLLLGKMGIHNLYSPS